MARTNCTVGLMYVTAWLVGAVASQSVIGSAAEAQRQPTTPRVFIEGFRVTDSLTRRAAAEVRAMVPRYVSQNAMSVMSSDVIQAHLDVGQPDDFGAAWTWTDLRKTGMPYHVDAIVDIVATRSRSGVTLSASRLRPLCTGAIMPLPATTAPTLKEAAQILAKRLATDSVLLKPVTIESGSECTSCGPCGNLSAIGKPVTKSTLTAVSVPGKTGVRVEFPDANRIGRLPEEIGRHVLHHDARDAVFDAA